MTVDQDTTQTDRLLQRIIGGDQEAMGELIGSHRRYLRKLIDLRMEDALRVRVDPSDVVQETQLVASQRLDDFLLRRPTSFRIWLRRKALEQLVDIRRRHIGAAKRSVSREVAISDQTSMVLARGLFEGTASAQAERHERAQQVRLAVQAMRDGDREVLLLRHVEGLSNFEVAEVLQIDTATASQRYGRALRRLREKLLKSDNSQDA